MNYQLEHVAIYTKDIAESIKYYEKFFGGHATPIRKGSAGYGFCFVRIAGSPSIQLMESAGAVGVHHYGYVTDDIDQVASEFKAERRRDPARESRRHGQAHHHFRQRSKRPGIGNPFTALAILFV